MRSSLILMILASPMILLRNDIQLTLNDIIFVLVFIRRSEYISPMRANTNIINKKMLHFLVFNAIGFANDITA